MIEEDFPIYNVGSIIAAGKNLDYKKTVIKMSSSLIQFLCNNNCIIELEPFNEDGTLKLDTVIKRKNLTDDGFELFRREIIDGWLSYLDRSIAANKYKNVSRLEKGLQEIRGE